jgi:hypothetical protein
VFRPKVLDTLVSTKVTCAVMENNQQYTAVLFQGRRNQIGGLASSILL